MKNKSLSAAQLHAVASLFSALAEPSRLLLLNSLQHGAKSVSQLVRTTGLKQANVSKQMGLLLDLKLVERRRDGNKAMYAIRDPMIFKLCDLVCGKIRRDASELI